MRDVQTVKYMFLFVLRGVCGTTAPPRRLLVCLPDRGGTLLRETSSLRDVVARVRSSSWQKSFGRSPLDPSVPTFLCPESRELSPDAIEGRIINMAR